MSGDIYMTQDGILQKPTPKLTDIQSEYIANNLDILTSDIMLPPHILDTFIAYYQKSGRKIDDDFANIFKDSRRRRITSLSLCNTDISTQSLRNLIRHNLTHLSIQNERIYKISLRYLLQNCTHNLTVLELVLPSAVIRLTINYPNLRRLILKCARFFGVLDFERIHRLTYLSLSIRQFPTFYFHTMHKLSNLTALILFNMWPMKQYLPFICQLSTLQILDMSVDGSIDGSGIYNQPDRVLARLVNSLPNLTYLDISGTNLAGKGPAKRSSCDKITSEIFGLKSRDSRPLDFLGLYNTMHLACHRDNIPALKIAGDANEDQILKAAYAYQDRQITLVNVLINMMFRFQVQPFEATATTLNIVLSIMERHPIHMSIQMLSNNILSQILSKVPKDSTNSLIMGASLRSYIVRIIITAIETNSLNPSMLPDYFKTLCHFNVSDLIGYEKRIVHILLNQIADNELDEFLIEMRLLNMLVGKIERDEKLRLGHRGIIRTMLNFIERRLEEESFKDVDNAWNIICAIAEDIPENCKRFLDGNGMTYFERCLNLYPDMHIVLQKLMRFFGTITETVPLRLQMMTESASTFFYLLDTATYGIEISYNSARILSHIASYGDRQWHIRNHTREEVLTGIFNAVKQWDLNSKIDVKYHSLTSLFSLMHCYGSPEIQHWATWALANLITVNREEYSQLLQQEQGVVILQRLIMNPSCFRRTKKLAKIVLNAVQTNLLT